MKASVKVGSIVDLCSFLLRILFIVGILFCAVDSVATSCFVSSQMLPSSLNPKDQRSEVSCEGAQARG